MARSFRAALRDVDERINRKEPNGEILDRMRAMDPEGPEEYTARGSRFSRMNRYGEAAADYQAAISANSKDDDPQAYFSLGGALSALGRREDAIGALRGALRLRPDDSLVACALSWELERLGRYGEALEVLDRHMKIKPDPYPCVHHQTGRVYGRQGRLKDAFASYLKALWFSPPSDGDNPTVKRRFKEMVAMRRRAEGMDPEDPRSFLMLGADLSDAGRDDLAVDVLDTLVWSHPNLQVYLLIGELRGRYLQLTEAIDAYLECRERFAGVAPPADMAPLYDALVADLFKCGRHQEVLRYGAEAVSLGAAGPDLLKYYTFVRDTPGEQSDADLMVNGWTAPYYANDTLDPARQSTKA